MRIMLLLFHVSSSWCFSLSNITERIELPRRMGVQGWASLGGVVLSITGVETMFYDLGYFSSLSIKIAFSLFVLCLILAYIGEVAFLSKYHEDIQRSFY